MREVVPEEKTYLELSEASGSSHKFYEVIVQDNQLTIRYGRIGDCGQTQTKAYPTWEQCDFVRCLKFGF